VVELGNSYWAILDYIHLNLSGKGGAGCGEGWHGIVCLEQFATVSEGRMGAAGVFGESDGVLGFFKLLSRWGF